MVLLYIIHSPPNLVSVCFFHLPFQVLICVAIAPLDRIEDTRNRLPLKRRPWQTVHYAPQPFNTSHPIEVAAPRLERRTLID